MQTLAVNNKIFDAIQQYFPHYAQGINSNFMLLCFWNCVGPKRGKHWHYCTSLSHLTGGKSYC